MTAKNKPSNYEALQLECLEHH